MPRPPRRLDEPARRPGSLRPHVRDPQTADQQMSVNLNLAARRVAAAKEWLADAERELGLLRGAAERLGWNKSQVKRAERGGGKE